MQKLKADSSSSYVGEDASKKAQRTGKAKTAVVVEISEPPCSGHVSEDDERIEEKISESSRRLLVQKTTKKIILLDVIGRQKWT